MAEHDYSAIARLIRASLPQCGEVRVIGIDGPAGSGKTTLAAGLSLALEHCPVVHMDDLYDGWNQDLEVELGQRIIDSILMPLAAGQDSEYEKYDWYKHKFSSKEVITHPEFLILEGVGSCNVGSASYLSYRIWVEADPSILVDRIISRDGEAMRPHLGEFKRREALYFANQETKQLADMHLRGD